MSQIVKKRLLSLLFIALGLGFGFFDAPQYWNRLIDASGSGVLKSLQFGPVLSIPFRLGLDLQGGTHLVYRADVSGVPQGSRAESMQGLRDVIERRVNLFGVTEPLVQIDSVGGDQRLIVELAGVRDINEAIRMIGETPFLEFREVRQDAERNAIIAAQKKGERTQEDPYTVATTLTGKYLKQASVNFDQTSFKPVIDLSFNDDGAKLFEQITERNVGKPLAIYLDGAPISSPRVNEKISGGRAQITGNFTPDEAKQLVRRLNSGALPVPIALISQQSVEASLGQESLAKTYHAAILGFLAVAVFMIFWYRLPGVISVLALLVYVSFVLAIFKLIPVTITSAGIAGFILSLGMAVDANILIFERMREEIRWGKDLHTAIHEGFLRAWTSIRDSNVSSLITAAILYWLGTSIVKGFALTLGIGVLVSMFSAITISRSFLIAFFFKKFKEVPWLF
ncbi:protein translocase subunit SecD [Patescibacteria group bacterium]|nr:protein translocase subunit SecD [Patescibacteria group bacterium]